MQKQTDGASVATAEQNELMVAERDYMSNNSMKRRIVVLVTIAMVVFIFVPTWWVTTRVYRATLPMEKIHSRSGYKMDMHLNFTLENLSYGEKKTHNECDVDLITLADIVNAELDQKHFGVLGDRLESGAQLHIDVKAGDKTPKEYFDTINGVSSEHSPGRVGNYRMYLKYSGHQTDKASPQLLLSNHRNSLLSYSECDIANLAESVQHALLKVAGGYEHLSSVVDRKAASFQDDFAKPETRYHVRASVIVADDRAHRLQWDTHTTFEDELQPMLDTLSETVNVTYSSQIVYHAALDPQRLTVHYDPETADHFLTPSDLKVFVDPIDWNFGTSTSDTTLNLLVYIPSLEESPLRIRDENSVNTDTNSFYLPGWGGVVVVNAEKDDDQALSPNITVVTHLPAHAASRVFSTFRQHLRALLAAPVEHNDETTTSTCTAAPEGVCQWETDIMQRRRIVQYVDEAFKSMSSLAKLLESIPNMAIADHLQQDVLKALSEIDRCDNLVKKGQYSYALAAAEQAYQYAEKAFFDPSILEMLYFPDEHKFAIYLPLFMPLGVSILVSFKKVLKDR
ncbi:hypothetical protein SARC_06205 [Sphaeroforma arctica JP610]|uniref:GPI transamidase component PIG-S n=1 Tax=Sphaeroforma arctica JP610 TaxID=667725 RepID=A0A0L0FXB6_9EUKA|nr:hypothetical protein SARC_06205 [Sphaeroforma arctica JP610]KNC81477.1 hypothetical protein SARC_06205 [Sphaeroforma arctica JP610]|eukprot:XP_014155379.1 hypothetical protein SARC_06205 [Sphaeroforma arctica JP610]